MGLSQPSSRGLRRRRKHRPGHSCCPGDSAWVCNGGPSMEESPGVSETPASGRWTRIVQGGSPREFLRRCLCEWLGILLQSFEPPRCRRKREGLLAAGLRTAPSLRENGPPERAPATHQSNHSGYDLKKYSSDKVTRRLAASHHLDTNNPCTPESAGPRAQSPKPWWASLTI